MRFYSFVHFAGIYNFLRNVDLDTLNKRAANYLRVLIFAILLSFAEIAEINTRENMSPYGLNAEEVRPAQCSSSNYSLPF